MGVSLTSAAADQIRRIGVPLTPTHKSAEQLEVCSLKKVEFVANWGSQIH